MKRTSLITLILSVICLMMTYVLDYWFGYYQTLLPLAWSMTLELVVLFIPLPVVLITWIVSMILRKDRLWMTATLIGLLVLVGLKFGFILPPPHHLIVYGMKNRMVRDYSLDDLRRLAHDVDLLPRSPNEFPGPTKGFMGEDLDKTGLKGKYPFLSWGGGVSHISERDGLVNVRWGGEPAGYWGFSVAVNGGKANPSSLDAKILRVSDDIFFIAE
jgi:hypothetical protein